jgi:predicted DNA-binding WGR domain protein
MRRFEFKQGSSYKFWEIHVEGKAYTARYGKVGTEGQTQSKSFATPEKATAEAEKKIREKVGKGYAEVAAGAALSAPGEAKQTVVDQAAEFAVRADQLQAAGDPWGQRIALTIALEAAKPRSPERRTLAKELAQLDREHGEHFFGALQQLMEEDGFEKVARLTWEYGYITRARVGVPEYDFEGPDADQILAALMASPASEFLRELTVGLTDWEGGGLTQTHVAIANGIVHPHLEQVFIGDFHSEQQEISWVAHGDVSQWFDKAPKLEKLRLHGANILLGKLVHPTLARLEVETGGLPEASVVSLAKAKLPELTHLEVWFGRETYGGTTNIAALRPLFSSKGLPKLEHLGLKNSEMQDLIVTELAKSKLLAAVSSVDLSMGTMREPGARAILANAARFKHLKSLNLSSNYIPADLCNELRSTLGSIVNVGRQNTPDVYDGEENYYTTVGE